MKQVVVQFNFPNVTVKQYDAIWDDLRASGNTYPKGLISHAGALTPDGGLMIVDIWESEEAFTEFGKILMPLITKQDIPLIQPKVFPVHFLQTDTLNLHTNTSKWPDELLENF
jgi:hypothetical protein